MTKYPCQSAGKAEQFIQVHDLGHSAHGVVARSLFCKVEHHAGKVCRSRATHILGTKNRKGKTRRSQAPRTPSEVTPPVTPRRPTPEDLPPPQCCGWDHGVSMWTLEDILTSLVPSTSENILASSGCFLSCCHCVSLRCLAQAIKH